MIFQAIIIWLLELAIFAYFIISKPNIVIVISLWLLAFVNKRLIKREYPRWEKYLAKGGVILLLIFSIFSHDNFKTVGALIVTPLLVVQFVLDVKSIRSKLG